MRLMKFLKRKNIKIEIDNINKKVIISLPPVRLYKNSKYHFSLIELVSMITCIRIAIPPNPAISTKAFISISPNIYVLLFFWSSSKMSLIFFRALKYGLLSMFMQCVYSRIFLKLNIFDMLLLQYLQKIFSIAAFYKRTS